MRIERIDLMIVKMELVRSFATSSSSKTGLDHILIKAYADGLVGWGEGAAPSGPFYCEETTETCWHMLRDVLIPATIGKEWDDIESFRSNYRTVKRNNFAKAGLEMACWDLLSQARGQSIASLLGGTRTEVLSGVSLGIERERSKLFEQIDMFLGEGYRRIKLKIAPGYDVEVVRDVRQRYPDVPLMVDANSAYTLKDIAILKELDQFDLMMIEQPLAHDDIIDHAKVQRELKTPICLDESIHSAEDARKAIELGSCKVINIKAARVGGLLAGKEVHDVCQAAGIPVWCGGMHEYGIGRAANLAISSLANFSLPGDVSGSDKYYAEDIVDPPIVAVKGSIPVPQVPGLGYTPNEKRIAERTLRSLTIEA
jgi:O-succinylbenzoate synthase